MKALRAFSILWLVLVFASSSVTMAIARHQPRAVGDIELCTGTGLVSVAVDARGDPTGPQMPCPDMTQALAALTDVSFTHFSASGALHPVQFLLRDLAASISPTTSFHRSRAPPVTV